MIHISCIIIAISTLLWRRKWHLTPVFLSGETYGQLAGGRRVGQDWSDLAHMEQVDWGSEKFCNIQELKQDLSQSTLRFTSTTVASKT